MITIKTNFVDYSQSFIDWGNTIVDIFRGIIKDFPGDREIELYLTNKNGEVYIDENYFPWRELVFVEIIIEFGKLKWEKAKVFPIKSPPRQFHSQ